MNYIGRNFAADFRNKPRPVRVMIWIAKSLPSQRQRELKLFHLFILRPDPPRIGDVLIFNEQIGHFVTIGLQACNEISYIDLPATVDTRKLPPSNHKNFHENLISDPAEPRSSSALCLQKPSASDLRRNKHSTQEILRDHAGRLSTQ